MTLQTPISIWFYLLWIVAFLGFPIGGAISNLLVGSVNSIPRAALAGLLTGAAIGMAQWLVLRQVIPVDLRWVIVSGVGLAVGLALGLGLIGTETAGMALVYRAVITGLVIGLAQWLLLRDYVPLSGWWILVIGAAWAMAWTITRAVGIDMSHNWSVFGSSGAIVFQILTAIVWRLLLA
jgi:hypothetical protein